MRTVEAILEVTEDGKLAIQLPEEVPTGRYKVIFALKNAMLGASGSAIAPLRKSIAAFDFSAFRDAS